MAYEIRRPDNNAAVIKAANFRDACKTLIKHADLFGGGQFEIWRVEKRGRTVTSERECVFEQT